MADWQAATELPSGDGGFKVTLHSFGRSLCQSAFDCKPMRRLVVILALAVLLGFGAYFVSYGIARCTFCRMPDASDPSSWLRQEFHLSDAQYAQVKKLEAGYHPHCVVMCDQIKQSRPDAEKSHPGQWGRDPRGRSGAAKGWRGPAKNGGRTCCAIFMRSAGPCLPRKGTRYLQIMQAQVIQPEKMSDEMATPH
jgi:hypothetical protein